MSQNVYTNNSRLFHVRICPGCNYCMTEIEYKSLNGADILCPRCYNRYVSQFVRPETPKSKVLNVLE